MSISNLYIFSKDTDANASLRGYHYQVLKAVETWVYNFLNKVDDEIYCDFEEDIFQMNTTFQTAKFRQIKLYSSNFSFASEEIKKCIAHFFMLHVKTDYTFLEKEFVFEANTSVAQKRGENDAVLLNKWNEKQGNLDAELLMQCAKKVKSIVSSYINEQVVALEKNATVEKKEAINEAFAIFSNLDDNDWFEFTKKIKWKFNNIAADEEFLAIRDTIEAQILQLPFEIDEKNLSSIFGMLNAAAWYKASAGNPQERKLTLDELKGILLQSANDSQRWYWQVAERWDDVITIPQFTIGEFYEVIDATIYCRQHSSLITHDQKWLTLLQIYIHSVAVDNRFRRKAIYEYLWLKFRPMDYFATPKGDLFDEKSYFDFYFNDFNIFRNAIEIEDAQNLLYISLAAVQMGKTDINEGQVTEWYKIIDETINAKLENETNPNEICHLLENLGTHHLFLNARKKENKDVSEVIFPLERIFTHINSANLYNATALSTRLTKYISVLIEVDADANAALIEAIENFTEKLNPLVEKRHGSYKVAKVEIEKGMQYLKSSNPTYMLKALNSLHKAKNLCYQQESIEGFVLALINISQLYSTIGLNLAAKYYALGAVWACIHNGSHHLLERISDAFGLVFFADFKQGAWMNAIISFTDYMKSINEFKGTSFDPETDEITFKTMAELTILLHAIPKISPQLKVLIDSQIELIGEIGKAFIIPLFSTLERDYPTDTSLKELLEQKLTDKPLNDVGKKRIVRFHALGSSWEVTFNNDFETTPMAEELCGILQVMLAEIALSKYDFHLVRGLVKIELETISTYISPEQLPNHSEFRWKIFLEYFDSAVHQEIHLHTAKYSAALMFVLEEISLLPKEEFRDKFNNLFRENDLAGKTLVLGSYQRMYRTVFKKQQFDSLQRQYFEPVDAFFLNLPVVNPVMEWNDKISSKYNHQEAVEHIKNRYKHIKKCIYITIEKLKPNKDFRIVINDLRSQGYQDWQIMLSIMNFMLNYKTIREIKNQTFETEEQHHQAYDKLFKKFQQIDEKDCYIEFPLEAFQSKDFKFQFNNTTVVVLKSFGLENNARFPNFKSVKDFLDIRFNMKNDILNEGSLLSDI